MSPTSTGTSQAAAAAAKPAGSTPTNGHKSSSHLGVGLGVGLGLGIPIVLALFGLLYFCSRRRRNGKRESFPRGHQQLESPDSSDWSKERPRDQMQQVRQNRESGTLGPWQSPTPQSRASQASTPFRPSYAPSGLSHTSWIDPFEFERPEMQDQDAMSQLRNSIYSNPDSGTIVHGHPTSRRSEMSFAGTDLSSLGGLPEQQQATYSRENWPLSS